MKKGAFIIIILLLFISCQKSKEVYKIIGKDWLLGEWENNSTNSNLSETWIKKNDSTFVGESYFIIGKDTLHSEQIKLEQKREDLIYTSTIKGQNNDKPISFIQNKALEKQLVFENPKNDYPKKISYTPLTKDGLQIEISGIQKGKPSSIKYTFKKKK